MPTGVSKGVRVVAASPYPKTGYPKELLKLCAQYKNLEPTRHITGKKMKRQYPVMYAEFVTMVKSHYAAANLAVPDEKAVDYKIKHAMERCTPTLLAKRKATTTAWKKTDKGRALKLRGNASNAKYMKGYRKTDRGKAKNSRYKKSAKGKANRRRAMKKIQERKQELIWQLHQERMRLFPHLMKISLTKAELCTEFQSVYYIIKYPQLNNRTLHVSMISCEYLMYAGITLQLLRLEDFAWLERDGKRIFIAGKNKEVNGELTWVPARLGNKYRSTLRHREQDAPTFRQGPQKGHIRRRINRTEAIKMGFDSMEVFSGRTWGNVAEMEALIQRAMENDTVTAGTNDAVGRGHGVPHHLHRVVVANEGGRRDLKDAEAGKSPVSACAFISFVRVTEQTSANMRAGPKYLPRGGGRNPQRLTTVQLHKSRVILDVVD